MSPQPPSFERVDYSLRTNKNIERKLVFDQLQSLSSMLEFGEYRYLGFGSLWFVDFVLAHRVLGINRLCSMEREASASRAEFNRPYSCIEVRAGDASEVLGAMPTAEWASPQLVWLDYDGRFDLDVASDCRLVLERGPVGTILIATANAHRGSYRRGAIETAAPAVQVLRGIFGDAVPTELPPGSGADVGESDFPGFLATTIRNFMGSVVRTSGRQSEGMPHRFIPLFEFVHRDNVPMVTVGGIIASWRMLGNLETHLRASPEDLFLGAATKKDVLDLVPITIKEKLALDSMMPCTEAELPKRIEQAGVKLPLEQVSKYRRLYPHFPLFGEMGF